MEKVKVRPEDLWEFIVNNTDELKALPKEIASNTSNGVTIYIDIDDVPRIHACVDMEEVEEEIIFNETDALNTAKKFYQWLNPSFSSTNLEYEIDEEIEEECEEKNNEIEIESRECDLDMAFEYLLDTIYDGDFTVGMLSNVKELVLNCLALKYPGKKIYRPSILKLPNGEEVFEKYPYDEYEIELD